MRYSLPAAFHVVLLVPYFQCGSERPGFVQSPEQERKSLREGGPKERGEGGLEGEGRVDSESALSSCHSLWGSSIRSHPKNSNGRRFKCKTAGFGAAASLRV